MFKNRPLFLYKNKTVPTAQIYGCRDDCFVCNCTYAENESLAVLPPCFRWQDSYSGTEIQIPLSAPANIASGRTPWLSGLLFCM